ncbi:MAG: hypothetical protein ACLQDV_15520 [Candidatus Binataceae bacterium]
MRDLVWLKGKRRIIYCNALKGRIAESSGSEKGFEMLTIGLAAGVYLYLLFLGWGLASLALPRGLRAYQVWLAPWIGMMLAAVVGVLLSRLGMGAAIAVYPITFAGAGLTARSLLVKPRPLPGWGNIGCAFAICSLVTLFLALYPLVSLGQGPTTVSLSNNDPVVYAATARFLEQGSLRHAPLCDVRQPLTCLVNSQIVSGSRPGTFLLIAILARLFHVPAFEIFTVLLAVILAATPPLAAIFGRVVSANRFAAFMTLVISAVNVNLLYFFYNGFAGQILGEGCLIVAFILLWKAEADQRDWLSYAVMLGLTICALLEIYQEDVPLFVVPYLIYAALRLFSSKTSRWLLVGRFALPVGIGIALDPIALWYCFSWLWGVRTAAVGWAMPRWALGADMVGFMNAYLSGAGERAAAIASIPVFLLAFWGFSRWRNPRLTLTVALFSVGLLLYSWAIRDFSYGYHKLAAILSFLLIAAFATGIARSVRRVIGRKMRTFAEAAAVLFAGAICVLVTAPLVEKMKRTELSVSSDLVELSEIKQIAGTRPILFAENRWWQQLWGTYFLYPASTLLSNPSGYFQMPPTKVPTSPDTLRLVVGQIRLLADSTRYFGMPKNGLVSSAKQLTLVTATHASETVLWRNGAYSLLGISAQEPRGSQVPLLRVIGEEADGSVTSKGLILDIPGDWARLRPNLKLSGPANHLEQLGTNPAVRATLRVPPQEVDATFETSADRYTVWIKLNPTLLPADKYIHVRVNFDNLAPAKSGMSAESSRLVMMGPKEISFSKTITQ